LILGNGSGAGNLTVSSLTIAGTGTANAVVGGAASVSKLTINNTSPAVYSGACSGVRVPIKTTSQSSLEIKFHHTDRK